MVPVVAIVGLVISAACTAAGIWSSFYMMDAQEKQTANYKKAVDEFSQGKYRYMRSLSDKYYSDCAVDRYAGYVGSESDPHLYYYDRNFELVQNPKVKVEWGLGYEVGSFKKYFDCFRFSGTNRSAFDFNPRIREAIDRLPAGEPDWFVCSQHPYREWIFTPESWKLAPMSFYDWQGNFYLLDISGQATCLLEYDKEPPQGGKAAVDTKNRYSTFSGVSLRTDQEAKQAVLLAEEAELFEKQQEEQQQLQSQALAVVEEQEKRRSKARQILSHIAIAIVVISGGFLIYKKFKKR